MLHDENVRRVAEWLFAPWQLLIFAGFLLYVVLVGYASWRVLLRLSDFPYRREMLWGARWMWAIMAVALGLAIGVTYCGAVYTSYPLTCIVIGEVVFVVATAHTMFLLPMRAEGWLFCLTAFGARLRGQQLDLDAWVTKRVRQYHNPWIKYGLGGGIALAVLLANGYLVLAFAYPFDRVLARTDREQRIANQVAADVRERLQGEMVVEIRAYGPIDLDSLKEAGTAAQAEASLREILAIRRPPPAQKPFHLFIAFTPEASVEDAEAMLAQARAVLAERELTGPWQISVYVPKGEVLARGEYP